MLSRLTNMSGIALRDWELHFDTAGEEGSSSTAGTALVIDLRALRSLMPLLPEHAFQYFASEYAASACHSLGNIIKNDMNHVVEVLSSLERNPSDDPSESITEDMDVSSACPLNLVSLPSQNHDIRSSHHEDVLGQLSGAEPDETQDSEPCRPKFTIPIILVSPCAPSEHHMACRVPIQNSAFGDQLTVPSHPALNHIFPPMVLPQQPSMALQSWTWRSGHWQATLPSIHEQELKGLFSRALKRKRTRRTRIRP